MVCTGILTVLLSPATSRAATCEQSGAKAMAVEGKVDVRHPDETQWQPVKLHDTFCPGDVIRVQERSRADIALANQPMLRLDQNTTMTLGGVKPTGGSIIELVKGATHFFSRVPRNLEVRTAFVNAGVEGTEGVIRVTDDKAEITIFEGKVVAANESGTLNITNGQSVVAEKGKAPSYQTVVKPRDAVQWALYYPPVVDGGAPEIAVKEDDPRSLANRAASSLAVGRVDEANADLDRALKLDPKNSDALALQSIIAVVQNDKDKALTLAQEAVAADPNSTSAKTALSYAQQARFDLNGARKTLEEEVQAHPDNALAWARLAELRASFSELDKALDAAQKAVALNPNLSRTQTVLGFAYLLQVKTTEAKATFTKAIELDQSDAMPRLGLGLAKFREGHVEEGRREMEVAASLDPNNSLIRSYLGKAYFEEKRDNLTEREYATAKDLDPKDPTPFFYDALQKQLTNRPIEALEDIEKAIELNDNRAVYRGRLPLDSDVAARSSALGRIYQNLGFQYQALVEGWSSVNTDPTSFAAHRFLADSYSVIPNQKIARVSELLVSQLLQPINITPIQPSQGESNLFLIGSQGAAAPSFNEFNTLMVNRDRLTLLTSGLVGGFNTTAGEAVAAGIYNKASFSVGYSYFNTDGWTANGRSNADQQDMIANAFVQYELTPKTNVQVEYRHRNINFGDTQLRFFKDDFSQGLRNQRVTDTGRFGLHHAVTPESDLIANVTYQNANDSALDLSVPTFAPQLITKQYAWQGEAAYLFRSEYINLFAGGGQANIGGNDNLNLLAPSLSPTPISLNNFNREAEHINGYLYSYLKPYKPMILTAGFSVDSFQPADSRATSSSQVNPKFGLLWNPIPSTTIRAAAFRTLKRTLLTDQTIEPTQVAGFNQFFDDFNTTSAWTYGGALNQKFPHEVYAGGEFTWRNMNVPFVNLAGTEQTAEWKERNSRIYLFWTPHQWVSLTAEWLWQRLERDQDFAFGASTVETNSFPVGINFFHPSGLSVSVKETYRHQQGNFEHFANIGVFENGHDDFWLLDAAINYRMSKRYGLITLGVTNLTDSHFQYFDPNINNATIQPERFFFAKITLALP
jgi:tetratricopeptide (TPR) repeat protein